MLWFFFLSLFIYLEDILEGFDSRIENDLFSLGIAFLWPFSTFSPFSEELKDDLRCFFTKGLVTLFV